jgi:hypothetical protein
MRRDPRELRRKIRKPLEHAEADSAAARLISGKLRPVEEAYGYAGLGKRSRGRRSGGASTDDYNHGYIGNSAIGIVNRR